MSDVEYKVGETYRHVDKPGRFKLLLLPADGSGEVPVERDGDYYLVTLHNLQPIIRSDSELLDELLRYLGDVEPVLDEVPAIKRVAAKIAEERASR